MRYGSNMKEQRSVFQLCRKIVMYLAVPWDHLKSSEWHSLDSSVRLGSRSLYNSVTEEKPDISLGYSSFV